MSGKNKEHLPMYGVGPIYVIAIIAVTAAAVFMGQQEFAATGVIDALRIPSIIIGILLIVFGVCLWVRAVIIDKVDSGITANKLVTSGVYSIVRNPIYTAFMFFCTAALLISGNVYFYPLFFFYWIFMTVLMKNTEEKWLEELYGEEYREYKRHVNRCIPFPRKK